MGRVTWRRTFRLFLGVLVIVASAACSGVSQDEFDRISKELDDAKKDLDDAKTELSDSVSQDEFDRVSEELDDTKSNLVDTKAELLSLKQTLADHQQASQQTSDMLLEVQNKHKITQNSYEDLRKRTSEVSHLIEFFVVSYHAEATGDYSKLGKALSLFGKIEDDELQVLIGRMGSFEQMSESDSDALMLAIFERLVVMLE